MAELLLQSLRPAILVNTFAEMVLLAGDLASAHMLLRRLAVEDTPWPNVGCAIKLAAADLDRRGVTYADPVMTPLLTAVSPP